MDDNTVQLRSGLSHCWALLESLDDGFCVLERVGTADNELVDFRYLQANHAFSIQSGLTGVIGKTIRQVVPGESEEWFRIYTAVLETGAPVHFERELVARGRILELFAFRIDGPGSDQIGVLFKDITARKALDEARNRSEVRYRRLFESAKDGILILDYATGLVVDANPFMGELLGYPTKSFCDKELWEIGLFQDREASQSAVRQMQTTGYVRFDHLPLKSRDGLQVEVEVVGNAYEEAGERVMQCNIRDISQRVLLERTNRDQAQTLLELHARKDEFLAMLSHELRTPLAPIANAAHLLGLQPGETAIQAQAREIIGRQVGQLKHLIDDLLEVSRITTGKMSLRKARVGIRPIVERAIEATRPLIEWRRHELAISLPPEPLFLDADAARLEQVLVNLLTNAAKYSDDGGAIWLNVAKEQDHVVIRVRDKGVGIEPDLLPRIFDLFTQSARSLDRSQGGLGIGLCLVQRLVQLHQGTVSVASEVGHGSEFVIRLRLADDSDQPRERGNLSPAAAAGHDGCRVLVVDDNVDTAESLAMVLAAFGHVVHVAHDGLAALRESADHHPEVILLDIGLPGLSGFEVASRIRAQPAMRGVLLVAMTGYGQDADRQRSQSAGFDHHLVKPADLDALNTILASVSARRRNSSATK